MESSQGIGVSRRSDDTNGFSCSPACCLYIGGHRNDHLIGTSTQAPQRPMVTYTGMGTVGPGPHGLLRP
ncbi:hypothetical protein TNCV_4499011 [Trichonephila clavipes]|nr:hypothetical protein TNCV_4499011 [Trichonephila clavipes]